MLVTILSWIAVLILFLTSTGLLLNRDWRWDLGLLAVQYLGVAWLVGRHLPLGMAAAKLVTGWMATAALAMTLTALPLPEEKAEGLWSQGRAFRLFMVGMVVVLTASIAPRMEAIIPGIGIPVIAGGILLIGTGLLHLGTSSEMERVIFGLLTVLAGFETLYAAVEASILVAALLAVVDLGVGLVGAYLLNASVAEESV
jgi:hypothetical protein